MAIHDAFMENEVEYLIANYATASWDDLVNGINRVGGRNRNKQSLIYKASSLGLRRAGVRNGAFSPDEDRMIKEIYQNSAESELLKNIKTLILEKLPHRTEQSIQTRASKLGFHIRDHWSDYDIEFLQNHYYTMFTEEIAEALNRTPIAVYNMVRKLGLKGAPRSLYSEDNKHFVEANYLEMSDEEIGAVLHRAGSSIKEFRRKNGIYRRDPNKGTNYLDIIRFVQAHNTEWKKRSMESCNYKCVITGGEFLDIHHLYAKNMIVRDALDRLSLPYDLDINHCDEKTKNRFLETFFDEQNKHPLGVCLDGKLHKTFHILYGFGDNTPEQFYEFAATFPQNNAAIVNP